MGTATSEITRQTRLESYISRPVSRCQVILDTLGSRTMTAREIATELHMVDLNGVKPRISEMVKRGEIVAVGKRYDPVTGKTVAIYRRTTYAGS